MTLTELSKAHCDLWQGILDHASPFSLKATRISQNVSQHVNSWYHSMVNPFQSSFAQLVYPLRLQGSQLSWESNHLHLISSSNRETWTDISKSESSNLKYLMENTWTWQLLNYNIEHNRLEISPIKTLLNERSLSRSSALPVKECATPATNLFNTTGLSEHHI